MQTRWFSRDQDREHSRTEDVVPTVDATAGDEGIDDPDVSAIEASVAETLNGPGQPEG